MFNSKKIKELEGRISALERQISSFLTPHNVQGTDKGAEISYEEVIDQWLNGKKE